MLNEKFTLMFTEITWATYLRAVAALMFIYYVLLILKFYFPQISASLSTAAPSVRANHHNQMTAHAQSTTALENERLTPSGSFTAAESGNDYEIIEEIVERVKSVLQHAADTTMEPSDVTSSFRTILADYPTLARSTFKPSINEFIANESEQHGYLTITQEAVEQLWPAK
jgi:uncharacterized protein YciW